MWGARDPRPNQAPQSMAPVPGREVTITSGCKTQWELRLWTQKPLGNQAVPLKEPTHRLTWTHSLWAPADWKAPETYGEKLSCSATGWELKGSFLPDKSAGRGHCSFSEPSPNRVTEPAGRCCIWDSINLAHSLSHSGDSLRPHLSTFRPIQAISSGFSIWMACLGSCSRFS